LPAAVLAGRRLLVLGGTGFLGKIFWVMLLDRFPQIERIYLLVRSGGGRTSEERFWRDIATSECLEPLRKRHGDRFEAFLRDKIEPIDGDVGLPLCGIPEAKVSGWRGRIDAVVNVAGVVDFNPPLDEALDTNAFGVKNLISLCRALGTDDAHPTPLYHTSTCYTVGNREGLVLETDFEKYPFPRCGELERELWDPEREIADCIDLVKQARARADDAFRQSVFLEQAKKNLAAKGEPDVGAALEDELRQVKRKFVAKRLVEAGIERATHWGWPNIYTYTKSIGEQIIAKSGVPFTIVRPACCESTIAFPFPGWNEGIGTSAPIIYLAMKGQHQVPSRDILLDFIPADMVSVGMILALCELLERRQHPVYQLGASDVNGATSNRFGELIALYKRKYYQRAPGNPLVNFLQSHNEISFVSERRFDAVGPGAMAKGARALAGLLGQAPGPLAGVGRTAAKVLEEAAAREEKIDEILRLFAPFTYYQKGPFSCANVRAAFARLSEEDAALLPWHPERIDWADYWMNQHMPAMEKRIIPWLDERWRRETKPLRAHATLASLVDQMAERFEHKVAFARLEKLPRAPREAWEEALLEGEEQLGFSPVTFREVRERADACAARLWEIGVRKGDRVLLSGKNHPDWAIAYFGIVRAGAVAVPVDPELESGAAANVLRESGAKVALWDTRVEERNGAALRHARSDLVVVHLSQITEADSSLRRPDVVVEESDLASIIFTSGTTGRPKGVKLTHGNFTSLVAALSPLFPLGPSDRTMSVLPLHHTFEFTCGLVLPFSRGARVSYLDELTGERLAKGMRLGRTTAMVGVPALWQMLERRIEQQVAAKGSVASTVFEWGTELNRLLGRTLGVDAGKLLFGPVHQGLGGSVRYLISGGAALPKETQKFFAGLGLKLAEGYGLTEAAPVLTVAKPSVKPSYGTVGKPIPGVELKIQDPDEQGVGEIVARGPNVMQGYTDDAATAEVLDADGWLRTGDLGKLSKKGELQIVGRVKDVIVTTTGENVYPDDVERALGEIDHVAELAIVGVEAPKGGERVACLAVPEKAPESVVEAEPDGLTESRKERREKALRALRQAIAKLPFGQQPQIVYLYDAPLPRTATRKVKRSEVRQILARLMAAQAPGDEASGTTPVRTAIVAVSGRSAREVVPTATLAGDLGFDSLMLTELLDALEARLKVTIEPEALAACQTVDDVERLASALRNTVPPPAAEGLARPRRAIEGREERPLVLPAPVRDVAKDAIGLVQTFFYGTMMKPRVYGRAYVPHNRNVIVASNHASHLDMGFVRHALGKYGEDIVSLAAADYFFDDGVKRAFFENFTNLVPLDRRGSSRASIRQASDIVRAGKTVLLFPEGTRSPTGEIQEFKPLVGHLALSCGVDVLPVYLGGTYAAMPRGTLVPRQRELVARIGPPLRVEDLRRLTAGMPMADAVREVTRLVRRAVMALEKGQVLDLSKVEQGAEAKPEVHPLVELFSELEHKFVPNAVAKPVSFYFTLGSDPHAKWTVKVCADACEVRPGKPDGGTADCVLKTSAEIFTRIVREAYIPGPAEFLSGQVKSNDVGLLYEFQKAFSLGH
jgi:long-chain acyl-CoA synthetase